MIGSGFNQPLISTTNVRLKTAPRQQLPIKIPTTIGKLTSQMTILTIHSARLTQIPTSNVQKSNAHTDAKCQQETTMISIFILEDTALITTR